jgi:TolB-like protein
MSNFWDELKRRNVIRETLAYLAGAWVLLQVADIVLEAFDAPDWISQTLIIIMAVGLPIWVLLSWAYKITLKGFERVSGPAPGESGSSRRNLLIMFAFATVAAVVLVYAFRGIGFKIREDAQYAVAIIPLRDFSQNGIDWFCHGLATDIRKKISRTKNLRPTAMRSASLYQDSEKLITEIAEELEVAYVLDGEVRMNGSLFLIDLQLIKEDGEVVWSEQYMVPKGEHYEVSQKVIEQIIESLEVNVTKEEFGYFSREGTQDEKAWESFAKGEKLINTLHGLDLYRKAAEYFEEAIRLDPEFAEAYAGLAVCQIYDVYWHTDSNKKLLPEAVKNAEKALQIDSTSALAYSVLGSYHWVIKKDFYKGSNLYNKAIELDPNNAYILWDYAWRISITPNTDMDLALAHINRAYELDPFASKVIWMKERIMWQSRDLKGLAAYVKSKKDTAFETPIRILKERLEVIRNQDERARISYLLDEIKKDSLNHLLYYALSEAYWVLNRHDKTIESLYKARDVAPKKEDKDEYSYALFKRLCEKGDYEKAPGILDFESPEDMEESGFRWRWRYYYYKGDYEKALEILNAEFGDEWYERTYRCKTLAKLGRKQEVHDIIKQYEGYGGYFWDIGGLVQVYAALGERDSMYHYLNYPINLNGFPVFDPYRKEPKFREWLRMRYLPQPEDTIVPE